MWDTKGKQRWLVILLPVLFVLAACSQKTLSVFFDLPSQTPENIAQSKTTASKQPTPARQDPRKTQPTDFTPLSVIKMENAKSWEEAEKLLPLNELGQRDWALALEKSIIQPRSTIDGNRKPGAVFKYDFYLRGSTSESNAYFPHSTHTKHLDCASCHPKLFRYRGTKITMDDIYSGKYCGFCHGTVSFAPNEDNCVRCHTEMTGKQQ